MQYEIEESPCWEDRYQCIQIPLQLHRSCINLRRPYYVRSLQEVVLRLIARPSVLFAPLSSTFFLGHCLLRCLCARSADRSHGLHGDRERRPVRFVPRQRPNDFCMTGAGERCHRDSVNVGTARRPPRQTLTISHRANNCPVKPAAHDSRRAGAGWNDHGEGLAVETIRDWA